jgi:hypothetical protein
MAGPADLAGPVVVPLARRASPAGTRLVIALVVAFALYYLATYVPARGNGSDFQVFYAGATADARGIDPFNWPQLWRVERALYNGGHTAGFAFAPYADPPPFALVLRPLTALTQSDAYRLWAAILLLCGGLGAYLCLPGWPPAARSIAATLVAISPAALVDLRLGQNSTPLLLFLGLCVTLLYRRQPWLAGVCLGCGLLKPHLMLPIAAIVLFAAPGSTRRPLAMGIATSSAIAVAIGVAFDGGLRAYGNWISSVRGFGDTIQHQPDIASIPGLYLGRAGAAATGALNLICLAAAAAIILRLAWSAWSGEATARERLLGGGVATYMALSPYMHTSDQVLLALLLLALIGPDGNGLRERVVMLAAVATLLAPMVVLRDYHTVGINALPPLCIALAYWLRMPQATAPAQARNRGVASYG